MSASNGWTRREFLAGSAAAAALAMGGLPARAASCSQVVVGTWGGDYQRLLSAHIDKPLMDPQRIESVQDVGTSSVRKTKLLAGRASRRAAMDIACLSDLDTYEMNEAGCWRRSIPSACRAMSTC